MLNKSKNVVADELLFTATHKFFDNMTREDIIEWANTCMEFVYEDLGYKKNQILHSVIHLDEETPHLHCIVVPLPFMKNDISWTLNKTKRELEIYNCINLLLLPWSKNWLWSYVNIL